MTRDDADDDRTEPARSWRPPTRRAFVAMLGAVAAALAVRPRATPKRKPLWIGHY